MGKIGGRGRPVRKPVVVKDVKRFVPSQFTETRWDTANEKAKFVNQFIKFVDSNFDWDFFPRWLYCRLCTMFGFSSYYDKNGFYMKFFDENEDKLNFFQTIKDFEVSTDCVYTYSDVENVIQKWVYENKCCEQLVNAVGRDYYNRDQAFAEQAMLRLKIDDQERIIRKIRKNRKVEIFSGK